MISYKRDVLERQSLSEINMGRGSTICERVRKKIVEYFKTTFLNVKLQRLCKSYYLQCITSSKDLEKLDARGLRALKRHCITHRHDSVIDITKWAQEYFQKPLSVNTIRRAICRCQLKLHHAKRKPYVNMVQKRCRVLWAKADLKWTFKMEKCSMVRLGLGGISSLCDIFFISDTVWRNTFNIDIQ